MPKEQFLKSMRYLAASVSIISAKDSNSKCFAMTASSVTSLTLDPPSILVCVNHEASIYEVLNNKEQNFCINLLQKDQQDIATQCSIKGQEEERFADSHWDVDSIPYLQNSQANIFCSVDKVIPYQTHSIVVGKVTECINNYAFNTLMYAEGEYL